MGHMNLVQTHVHRTQLHVHRFTVHTYTLFCGIKWKIYLRNQTTGYAVKSEMKIDHQNKNDFIIVGSAVVWK